MIRYNGIAIDRGNRTITHAYHTEHFPWREKSKREYVPGYKFKTFCDLILGEFSRAELFERTYGDCENGGPNFGLYTFDVRFSQWRPVFKRLQLRLNRCKTAGLVRFKLVPDVV